MGLLGHGQGGQVPPEAGQGSQRLLAPEQNQQAIMQLAALFL